MHFRSDVQTFGRSDAWTFGRSDARTLGRPDARTSRRADVQTPAFPSFSIFAAATARARAGPRRHEPGGAGPCRGGYKNCEKRTKNEFQLSMGPGLKKRHYMALM